MTESGDGFVEWRPDVDPEFDEKAFPGLGIPVRAIRGWTQYTLFGEPTGPRRANEQYRPGPVWRGFPVPTTDAEKLLGYLGANWISRAEFVTALLDCEVLVPALSTGEPLVRPVPSGQEVIAYSSSAKVPGRYPHRWRVTVRELLADRPSTGLTLDPGTGLVRSLTAAELADAGPGERRPQVAEPAPEAGPEVAEALPALVAEFGVEPPDLLARHLRYAVDHARDHHFELPPEDCVRYLRGFAWQYRNGVRRRAGQEPQWPADLGAHGLIAHVDEDARPRPVPWTFGKFSAFGTVAARFAWHRIVGAYVGFAIGDALGGGATGSAADGRPDPAPAVPHRHRAARTATGADRRGAGHAARAGPGRLAGRRDPARGPRARRVLRAAGHGLGRDTGECGGHRRRRRRAVREGHRPRTHRQRGRRGGHRRRRTADLAVPGPADPGRVRAARPPAAAGDRRRPGDLDAGAARRP